ncbi:unnamed protein product [Scytosiphon promiscuus]
MPRSPRFVVLEKPDSPIPGTPGIVARSGLAFPVICKPVEACGTRGSHTMVVVLDQAGMAALTPPVVVQEYRNHGARLFKVCVVGDEVRVLARTSLPDLPPGLGGSFAFDSQKPYPTLSEVGVRSSDRANIPARMGYTPIHGGNVMGTFPNAPRRKGAKFTTVPPKCTTTAAFADCSGSSILWALKRPNY